jgi:hypothetical protein
MCPKLQMKVEPLINISFKQNAHLFQTYGSQLDKQNLVLFRFIKFTLNLYVQKK